MTFDEWYDKNIGASDQVIKLKFRNCWYDARLDLLKDIEIESIDYLIDSTETYKEL